jgi:hypothetical protein
MSSGPAVPRSRKLAEAAVSGEPWQASDGTCWLHFPASGEWHGREPGEDGLFILAEEEFGRAYPERWRTPARRAER